MATEDKQKISFELVQRVFEHATLLGDKISSSFIYDCINNGVYFDMDLDNSKLKVWNEMKEADQRYFITMALAHFEHMGIIKAENKKGGKGSVKVYSKIIGKKFNDTTQIS